MSEELNEDFNLEDDQAIAEAEEAIEAQLKAEEKIEYKVKLGEEDFFLSDDPSNVKGRWFALELNQLTKKNRLIRAKEAKWTSDYQNVSSRIIYKDDDHSPMEVHLINLYEVDEPEYEWTEVEVKEKYKDEDGVEKERVKVDEDGVVQTKMKKGKKKSDTKWINDEYFLLYENPSVVEKIALFYIPEFFPDVLDRINWIIATAMIDDEKIANKSDYGKKEIAKLEKKVEKQMKLSQTLGNLVQIVSWLVAKGFGHGTPLQDFATKLNISKEDQRTLLEQAQKIIAEQNTSDNKTETPPEEENKKKA